MRPAGTDKAFRNEVMAIQAQARGPSDRWKRGLLAMGSFRERFAEH